MMENLFLILDSKLITWLLLCTLMFSSTLMGFFFLFQNNCTLYELNHTCCIHIIENSNNRIHEEEIQIQLMMMMGSLEWVVILFSPFRCFIIPFLCSQHAIKFFDFSFSLCISVTRALVNIIFKHVQFLFRY